MSAVADAESFAGKEAWEPVFFCAAAALPPETAENDIVSSNVNCAVGGRFECPWGSVFGGIRLIVITVICINRFFCCKLSFSFLKPIVWHWKSV